jgi:hypothetical protein
MEAHSLFFGQNTEFFLALLDVLETLRLELWIRECHPVHEKMIELIRFIREDRCQDFVPSLVPNTLTK